MTSSFHSLNSLINHSPLARNAMLIKPRWRIIIIKTLSHQNLFKMAAAATMATCSNSNPPKTITFGPYEVTPQVLFSTPFSSPPPPQKKHFTH